MAVVGFAGAGSLLALLVSGCLPREGSICVEVLTNCGEGEQCIIKGSEAGGDVDELRLAGRAGGEGFGDFLRSRGSAGETTLVGVGGASAGGIMEKLIVGHSFGL